MSDFNDKRARELDEFWDIDQLLPKSKSVNAPRPASPKKQIEAVEIKIAPPSAPNPRTVSDAPIKPSQVCNISEPTEVSEGAPIEPDLVYAPNHPLLREIRVYRWRSSFRFYERFCATAERMFSVKGKECPSVPFFSYMPQYDQMNRAQLSWYLYWRDNARAGIYLPTDYSYIFLYLFEIINLPKQIPPIEGQRALCEIWKNYRSTYPLLNRYLADWICDYSLIHQLPPPIDVLSNNLRLITESSSFREFYACPSGDDTLHDADVYMLFCSNYDYRKSKAYRANDEQKKMMDRHIPRAFSAVLRMLEQKQIAFSTTKMQKATLSRDTFIGALCSADMKRRIEVDYCSFTRSHELRFLITDILKYSENKLRAYFGSKSKLTIYGLPDEIKTVLDEYFTQALPSHKSSALQQVQRPDYEALYDLPTTELSPEHAAEIERSSWSVTEQLIEAFEDSTPVVEPKIQVPQQPSQAFERGDDWTDALQPYREFLAAVCDANAAKQRDIARSQGVLIDALAERINEVAADAFGDIILQEGDGGGYVLIEDYEQQIQSAFQNNP